MTSSSIYRLPHDTRPLEADSRNYPAEHSRSAGRAGFLKIDCLQNDPAGELECESKIPSNGTKEMLHRERGGMFAATPQTIALGEIGQAIKQLLDKPAGDS